MTYDLDKDTGKVRGHYVVKEIMDGKMQTTNDYYED